MDNFILYPVYNNPFCFLQVKFKHTLCAAKRIYNALIDPANKGAENITLKYRHECRMMASLRHPNIIQFIGLSFLEGSLLPLLIMEKLEMSLDDYLESAPHISLQSKLSILIDICKGLVFIHGREEPIMHRDLTARNVLLTSSMQAKISDLGNSRMILMNSSKLTHTLSKQPGTTVYMPPEALNDIHAYGTSLDIFSYGHLSLYTLIQVIMPLILVESYLLMFAILLILLRY